MDVDESQAPATNPSWRLFALGFFAGLGMTAALVYQDSPSTLVLAACGAALAAVSVVVLWLITRPRLPGVPEITLTALVLVAGILMAELSGLAAVLGLWLATQAFVIAIIALFLRAKYGWRIARATEEVVIAPLDRSQFSLVTILVAGALVAIGVALVNRMYTGDGRPPPSYTWCMYLLMFGSLAAEACYMAGAILRSWQRQDVILMCVVPAVAMLLIDFLIRRFPFDKGFILLVLTGYAVQLGLIAILRTLGYRLVDSTTSPPQEAGPVE